MKHSRRIDIDFLKGIAIIGVVLYHMGITKSGYLGVDVFFVISGFFIVPKVFYDIEANRFNYLQFLWKRLFRLLPLLLFISVIALAIGYWGMFPDDLENLSESIVASSMFSNNLLSYLTLGNYWNTINEFKPLMHTWYLGILFEFYVILPLILLIVNRIGHKNFYCNSIKAISVLSLVSLILYLLPGIETDGCKFYMIHTRFFELATGGLLGLYLKHDNHKLYAHNNLSIVSVVLLVVLIFAGCYTLRDNTEIDLVTGGYTQSSSLIPPTVLLLSVVILTSMLIATDNTSNKLLTIVNGGGKFVSSLGVMSYSIYLWHQPMLALYRYFYTITFTPLFYVCFFFALNIISAISYFIFEKKLIDTTFSRWFIILSFIFINSFAFYLYKNSGITRDIPELNITAQNAHKNTSAGYNDRISKYDHDFTGQNKYNVYLIGNSFARDMGNVLLESSMSDSINISYTHIDNFNENCINRLRKSNYIFFFGWKHDVPQYVWDNIPNHCKVYGIGTKSYGNSNGAIYKHRGDADYFNQTKEILPTFFTINQQLKHEWGNDYIDFLTPVSTDGKTVNVFTDTKKLISFDSEHLTKDGAKFYARKLSVNNLFY